MTDNSRQKLLDAGRRIALRENLAGLTALTLCAEARTDFDEFERHFATQRDFLLALQQDFMDGLRDKIFAITTGTRSPLMRLKLATETYLQGCIADRALRRWLLEARVHPEMEAGVRRQNQTYWMILGAEFRTLGWPYPQAAARLYLAMTNEAANAEHRVGHALPAVRETLWDFLDHRTPVSRPGRRAP
jgi:TetR/AcrR family transcriptional repressor of nem operon